MTQQQQPSSPLLALAREVAEKHHDGAVRMLVGDLLLVIEEARSTCSRAGASCLPPAAKGSSQLGAPARVRKEEP